MFLWERKKPYHCSSLAVKFQEKLINLSLEQQLSHGKEEHSTKEKLLGEILWKALKDFVSKI